jgi:hypothetical protein
MIICIEIRDSAYIIRELKGITGGTAKQDSTIPSRPILWTHNEERESTADDLNKHVLKLLPKEI